MYFADTASRVAQSSGQEANERIQFMTEAAVAHYAQRLEQIEYRLRHLQREWDIERSLQANAGIVMGVSLLLGTFIKPFRLLPMAVAAFMVVHAVDGWCPPLPIMRRMGIRTAREIYRERYALKALRGNLQGLGPQDPGDPAEKAKKAAQTVSEESAIPQTAEARGRQEPVNVP